MLTFTVLTTAVYTIFRAIYNYQERVEKNKKAKGDEGLERIKNWMAGRNLSYKIGKSNGWSADKVNKFKKEVLGLKILD